MGASTPNYYLRLLRTPLSHENIEDYFSTDGRHPIAVISTGRGDGVIFPVLPLLAVSPFISELMGSINCISCTKEVDLIIPDVAPYSIHLLFDFIKKGEVYCSLSQMEHLSELCRLLGFPVERQMKIRRSTEDMYQEYGASGSSDCEGSLNLLEVSMHTTDPDESYSVENGKEYLVVNGTPHSAGTQKNSSTHRLQVKKNLFPPLEQVTCTICGLHYANMSELQEHMLSHDPLVTDAQDSNYVCEFCFERFDSQINLAQHVHQVHLDQLRYHCKHCDKVFSSKGAYRTHACRAVFKCRHCLNRFYEQAELSQHIYNAHADKIFQCKNCGVHFRKASTLETHSNSCVFKREKTMQCRQCGKKYHNAGSFKSHLRKHREERYLPKSFQCSHCDARFDRSASLFIHMRRHTGEMPFQCAWCNKRFRQSSNLHWHLNRNCIGVPPPEEEEGEDSDSIHSKTNSEEEFEDQGEFEVAENYAENDSTTDMTVKMENTTEEYSENMEDKSFPEYDTPDFVPPVKLEIDENVPNDM